MRRFLTDKMLEWKNKNGRKPLLLQGARQVGKTWLMKEFGRENFNQVIYINFDKDHRLHDLLESTLEPKKIITAITAIYDCRVNPDDTLIIFDEVQEEPRALTSLKYFCEDAPGYAVMAAGSFMGIALRNGTSFPVGKVDRMILYPLTFREFLHATGKQVLCDIIDNAVPEDVAPFKSTLIEALKYYYFVGGMPEVVQEYIDNNDFRSCRAKQEELCSLYRQDFSKHAYAGLVPRLNQVWESIPGQLAKENRKFIYGRIEKGARAKDFELALQWLQDCGLIYRVHRVSKPGLPLKFYEEMSAFKIFLHDVGLFGAMCGLQFETIFEGNRLFEEYKGAMTEQYVLQQFVSDMEIRPYYFSTENSQGELDFLLQNENSLIPIEVKAEENLKAKSLRAFVDKYGIKKGIRISMSDYREQDWLVNIPLYAFMKLIK